MTYQIITPNEKEKAWAVWCTFQFSAEKGGNAKVKSFLEYLKSGIYPECFKEFLIREVETNRAFVLEKVYDKLLEELSK